MELDKLKIRFNYTLARLRKGELYVTTSSYREAEPKVQEQAVKLLEKLGNDLVAYRKEYEELTGQDMTDKEYDNGFYD